MGALSHIICHTVCPLQRNPHELHIRHVMSKHALDL